MAFFFTVLKFMDLMYRIQKNSMNITCFSPQKIIFNLVRLLHTLRKQLNFKYKMLGFFLINLQKIAGACSTSHCALNEKCIPKPFGKHECILSGLAFMFFPELFFMFKIASFLSCHFKTLLYYDCQLIFILSIISVI